ncbi:unnamed protein product [Caenorhabditis brenneri]
MPGNRTHQAAPRTTQGRKRKAPAMQDPVEAFDSTENEFAPLPEKRRARGRGEAIQPAHSRTQQKQNVAMNTLATSAKFHTPGASSSDTSRISSVKASTPNPQHYPMPFVKPEVDQVMDMMIVKDEAPHPQEAPELADIAWEDRESKQILQYNLHHRLHFLFVMNKDQVDLKKMEPFEATDSEFGNWTSLKILQFFATILPAKLMDIYKLFKFPSQLLQHLNSRDVYIDNQDFKLFWYELIGMSDEDYDKVLKGLWKLKYGSEDGYEEWRGKDVNLKKEMDVGREEFVSLDYVQEGKAEEDQVPGANEEVEKEKYEDTLTLDVNLEEDEEDEDEKQIVEKEGEVYLEPKFFEEAPMANANDAAPKKDQPAPELKCEQIQNHRNFHAHAQEDSLLAPAPASPVAHPAAPAQAPPQVRPPPDAPRLNAELFSELERLGLVPPLPADPARINPLAQAPLLGGWQQGLGVPAPAPPDAPAAVQAPLLGGWQQGLGVPAPAPPDAPAAVQAPLLGGWQQGLVVPAPAQPDAPPAVRAPLLGGWQQDPGYWAPLPQAAPPAIPVIPDAWIPREEGAYGRMSMLCIVMKDILEAGAREQQVPELLAPAPQAVDQAVWDQQQLHGFMDIPPLAAPQAVHAHFPQQQREHQALGFLAPPLPAPAPIDQHLGVQAAHWSRQDQFSGFQAPPPVAVPPMDPRVQAPPPFHPHSHLVLVPRDGQPYAPPPYRPIQ